MIRSAYPAPLTTPDPHNQRRKDILEEHSQEVRALMGTHPMSFFWILGIVAAQFAIAYALRNYGWGVQLLFAFGIGAFFNHALYVFIHEAAHNLIFSKPLPNRIAALICDFPLLTPGSMAFRKYHLIHHTRFGQYEYDADICSVAEAKLVGNGAIRKTIWCFFLGISQGLRPARIQNPKLWDVWQVINLAVQIAVIATIITTMGVMPLVYLMASSIFGLGLHPLGARWIAEHFLLKSDQETYSYYGPLNKVVFNVGYHVEHHDFMTIPWVNLPKLCLLAKPHYDSLISYPSYSAVMWEFITNTEHTLFARTLRLAKDPRTTEQLDATSDGSVPAPVPVSS